MTLFASVLVTFMEEWIFRGLYFVIPKILFLNKRLYSGIFICIISRVVFFSEFNCFTVVSFKQPILSEKISWSFNNFH